MQPPQRELWVEKIENPVTRERTRRKLLKAYDIEGDVLYGSAEVYDRLREMGYDVTYRQVKRLVNDNRVSKSLLERYPELDPDNPESLVKLVSKGQYYDRFKRHRSEAKFLLVYYFENLEHTRFYGVTCFLLDNTYRKFCNALRYFDVDQDISHYTFNSDQIVQTDGTSRRAYEAMDRSIFEYLVDNPEYDAYNLDLVRYF